jgi:cell wall assembly regulator SMI1
MLDESKISLFAKLDSLLYQHARPIARLMRSPATLEQIDEAQRQLGMKLPSDVRAAYLWHDGQEYQGAPHPGLFGAFTWPSLDNLVGCWSGCLEMLRDLQSEYVTQDEIYVSLSDQEVRFDVWHPKWLPVGDRRGGGFLCVDLAPGPRGSEGQLIECSLDNPDGNRRIAVNLETHLQDLVQRLETGIFRFSVYENCWIETATGAVTEARGYW